MAPSRRELDEWIRRVAPRALAYARSLLPTHEAAEDIVQDVMLRLLDHPEYDLVADGEKLLFKSITNACVNAARRRTELSGLAGNADVGPDPIETAVSSWPADPVDTAAAREFLAAVGRELQRLPTLQRAAVELKAMGRSLSEIAEVLQVSPQNAGVLVHRGRKCLKQRLGPALPGGLQ